ncbi:uncharacterized protein LY79DRAFT_404338 [Colletotrichum navitas]|uniref:Uncharacterized protein n=1 Tax=Colletotrichum navitas TaxID=681940 RepID=A0AAD8Q8R7_9PEZI|nr:uncharacterized protein LY79DRAFT_404338 [Colletotrichum navitas]KAK1597072.1 hypothetical protein LY79DRAFT_404338 [Colletotrichum navitas]
MSPTSAPVVVSDQTFCPRPPRRETDLLLLPLPCFGRKRAPSSSCSTASNRSLLRRQTPRNRPKHTYQPTYLEDGVSKRGHGARREKDGRRSVQTHANKHTRAAGFRAGPSPARQASPGDCPLHRYGTLPLPSAAALHVPASTIPPVTAPRNPAVKCVNRSTLFAESTQVTKSAIAQCRGLPHGASLAKTSRRLDPCLPRAQPFRGTNVMITGP